MINKIYPAYNLIAIKSMLYSLIFHKFLFKAVIFTFSPKQIPEKPLLVFLGSILHTEDLTIIPLLPSRNVNNFEALKVHPPILKNTKYPEKIPLTSKRSFTKTINPTEKIFVKSTFYTNNIKKPPTETMEKILGIELRAPKRRSLKLPENDKN